MRLRLCYSEKSMFLGIKKDAVLQEAESAFNDPHLDARRCTQVIVKLLYLIVQGETFTKSETTTIFFSITKLFHSNNKHIRRLVYLMIKEISPCANEVIIILNSLLKDMNNATCMYKTNAIRVFCATAHGMISTQIDGCLKQAILDTNPVVSSGALVSGMHLLQTNPKVVRRWSNVVRKVVHSNDSRVQFHALGLLYKIHHSDSLAINKLFMSMSKGCLWSPLTDCLLIRYISQVIREPIVNTENTKKQFFKYLETCLRQEPDMVKLEAARAIAELSEMTCKELNLAVLFMEIFSKSSEPLLRFAGVRTLNKIAARHPKAVFICNYGLGTLIFDHNGNIATLAIRTLLQTVNESRVDWLMDRISKFMLDDADESKIIVVEAVQSLCLRFPLKQCSLICFLCYKLRKEDT